MAARGEITPKPAAAVFADTGSEPAHVYNWLDWLEKQLDYPLIRATKKGAPKLHVKALVVRTSKKTGNNYLKHMLPCYTLTPDGKQGHLQRQCTEDFKITVIQREAGILRRKAKADKVVMWIGISTDEAGRMKPSRVASIEHRWPLIDMEMSRQDCLDWAVKAGLPEPPRSACIMCPYRSPEGWLRMKTSDPGMFRWAAAFELRYQRAVEQITRLDGVPYLSDQRKPLDSIDFEGICAERAKKGVQMRQFNSECTGICGV